MLKYQAVAHKILTHIEENKLQKGDKLESIEALAERYETSKNTIIKALDVLDSKGIIYQVRGSGIFVRGHKRKGYINLLEMKEVTSSLKNFNTQTEVLALEVQISEAEIEANLELEDKAELYYVKRLHAIEGRPFSIEESYYLKEFVPYLNQEIAEASIFDYLERDLELGFAFVDHFMRIVTLAPENRQLLNLRRQKSGLLIESVYSLKNGRPFNYKKTLFHPDEAQFFVMGQNEF